jgi:hypothetical protein
MLWLLKIASTLFVLAGFSLTAIGVNNLNEKLVDVEGKLGEFSNPIEDMGAEISAATEQETTNFSGLTLPASSIFPETFGGNSDYIFPGNLGIKGGQLFLTPISEGYEQEGAIYYDDDNDKVYVRGSTGWIDLAQQDSHGSTSGLISKPTSSTQGDILYRGATSWDRLAAGTSGYFLKTQGSGANPTWDVIPTDPTSATLVVAASDSKNTLRADYVADGTDDQAQIQTAIDALPSGGGKVVLLEGNYSIGEPITITANNITIEGEGENTVLTEENGVLEADYGIISVSNAQYFVLRDLKLDGNKDNQSAYVQTPAVVSFSYVTYGLVENIHLLNSMGDGVEPNNSTNITVRSSHIHDCTEHAIHYNGVTNGWILENYLHDDGNSLIAQGHGGVKNVVVSNNILETANSGSFMIQVSGNDTDASMRERVYVTNNIMDLDGGLGIYVAEDATHILIAHNDIRNGGGRVVDVGDGAEDVRILYNDAEDSERGIRVYGSHNYVVGNTVRNSEVKGNYAFEIYGDHHMILDNKIDGIAYYGYSPIELYATNTYVMRNFCKQRADKPSSEYGIEEKGSADYNYIAENDLTGGTWSIAPILTVGANTTLRDNLGYATHNSGTATVGDGDTTVDVAHGLAVTPSASDVQVTPTNDLGNATKFWISDLGASTFRINVDGDPGASTATFAWSAVVY